MNKFQPFAFTGINDFLSYLPDDELKIVEVLRTLVFKCIPDVKEKLSYIMFLSIQGIPEFVYLARLGAVGKENKTRSRIWFCKGNLLADPSYLNIGHRKEVYIKTFYSIKEIDLEIMHQLLFEAVVIDEELALNKKAKNQKR